VSTSDTLVERRSGWAEPDHTQVLATVLGVAAVAFGAAVAVGIVRTLGALVVLSHPDPGWGYFVFDDAVQVYLGHLPYQDPADGYTGLLYPPVFSTLVGVLLHVKFWAGWGVVVSMFSGLALVVMTARVAFRPSAAFDLKAVNVAEAAAIGFVGWWLVSIIPISGSLDSRPDTLAWALGIAGLLLAARALPSGRIRTLAGAILLLSGAFWTKQPALAAGLAAGAFAVIMAVLGVCRWRRALLFVSALGALNLAILGVLSLVTHGWLYFLVFSLARRQFWGVAGYGDIVRHELGILWAPGLFAVVALAAGAAAAWRGRAVTPRVRVIAAQPEAQRVLAILLFLGILLPMETYFQRKQGAESEHLIGVAWGLVLLAAAGYRLAGRDRRLALVPLVGVGVIALGGLAHGTQIDDGSGHVPRVTDVRRFAEVPANLLAVASRQPLYDARLTDLSRDDGAIAPNYTVCDLVAAGVHPGALENALLDRVYRVVTPFPETDGVYCSGHGRWEENYFWKLNQVIERGYAQPADSRQAGLLVRRPGNPDMNDLRGCFAPFGVGGALFRIGHGGGFWCRPSGNGASLVLRSTPAPYSEVVTDGVVTAVSGALTVTLPNGGGSATVSAARAGGVTRLATVEGARDRSSMTLVFDTKRTTASDGNVRHLDATALEGARLVLAATSGSEATFELSGLRVSTKDGTEVGKASRRLQQQPNRR
jgi:hypothetical protein